MIMPSLLVAARLLSIGIVSLSAVRALAGDAAALPDVIEKIKPAIVGIGTFQKTRRPAVDIPWNRICRR